MTNSNVIEAQGSHRVQEGIQEPQGWQTSVQASVVQ